MPAYCDQRARATTACMVRCLSMHARCLHLQQRTLHLTCLQPSGPYSGLPNTATSTLPGRSAGLSCARFASSCRAQCSVCVLLSGRARPASRSVTVASCRSDMKAWDWLFLKCLEGMHEACRHVRMEARAVLQYRRGRITSACMQAQCSWHRICTACIHAALKALANHRPWHLPACAATHYDSHTLRQGGIPQQKGDYQRAECHQGWLWCDAWHPCSSRTLQHARLFLPSQFRGQMGKLQGTRMSCAISLCGHSNARALPPADSLAGLLTKSYGAAPLTAVIISA